MSGGWLRGGVTASTTWKIRSWSHSQLRAWFGRIWIAGIVEPWFSSTTPSTRSIIYIYIRLSPCFRNHGFGLRRNIFGANDYRIVFTGNMFYWMLVSLVISQSNFLKVLCIRNESPVAFLREAGIGRAAVAASWDPIVAFYCHHYSPQELPWS